MECSLPQATSILNFSLNILAVESFKKKYFGRRDVMNDESFDTIYG